MPEFKTAMKMYQLIFQTGRVQNTMADGWRREQNMVRFHIEGKEVECFPARDLIMIDDLDSGRGQTLPSKRQAAYGIQS